MPLALSPSAPPFPFAGELSAALSALLWAAAGIAFARLRPPITAGALNLGKNLSATSCFVVTLLVTTGALWPANIPGDVLLCFLASGFIGLALCDTLLLRSLLAIGPRRLHLVMCFAPVVVAIGVLFPPFDERPPVLAWAGMAVCLGGIVLSVLDRPSAGDRAHGPHFGRGIRTALIAAVLQGAAVLLARHGLNLAQVRSMDGAMVRMVAGTVGVVVIGLPAGRILAWNVELRQTGVIARVFIAAFVGTFLGIWTNQLALEWSAHTGVASTLNALMPVYLIPLSAVFLKERTSARGWLATLVALAGIALMTIPA